MSTQVLQVIAREETIAPNSKNSEGNPRKMVKLGLSKTTYLETEHPETGELIRVKGRSLTRTVVQFAEPGTSNSGQKLSADTYHDAQVGQFIPGTIISGIPVKEYYSVDRGGNVDRSKSYTTITEAFIGDTTVDGFQERVQKAAERHMVRMSALDAEVPVREAVA